MSYKNAIADLPLGGGKAVFIGDPATDKTEGRLLAYADAVNTLSVPLHHGDGCRHDAARHAHHRARHEIRCGYDQPGKSGRKIRRR